MKKDLDVVLVEDDARVRQLVDRGRAELSAAKGNIWMVEYDMIMMMMVVVVMMMLSQEAA